MAFHRDPIRMTAVRQRAGAAGRAVAIACALAVSSCTVDSDATADRARPDSPATAPEAAPNAEADAAAVWGDLLPGMPPPLSPTDIYAANRELSPAVREHRELVYVPNSQDNTVSVIDPRTFSVIDTFPVGDEPQHVVPSYDLKTLYVTSDMPLDGGSLTPIDPATGAPGPRIPVHDPYNLYFTPDGQYAIVVAEAFQRLDFYDPRTWEVKEQLHIPACEGIDHMDFTADGKRLLASCEFAGRMVVVDVPSRTHVKTIDLPSGPDGMPQDVKLSPDGKTFYVADMMAGGVFVFDGQGEANTGFIPTGEGTHGLYVTRDSRHLLITNRGAGTISVLDFATGGITATWQLPAGASPDMGNISADGTVFWASGRYSAEVYAIDTANGSLIARIPVGNGPHGLTVWPQPGRYSTGHTGVMR